MIDPNDPRHGENRGYEAGCRELCCRRAHMRYSKQRRLVGQPLLVDITGTRRRIEALQALGWSTREISRMLDRDQSFVRLVLTRTRAGKVQRKTAIAIAELYERLCMTVAEDSDERVAGWNASKERTRREARAKGYAPPLAWEGVDIDDPAAVPFDHGYRRRQYRSEDLLAEWQFLRRSGVSIHTAASQLGVSVGAIEKAIERAGRDVA